MQIKKYILIGCILGMVGLLFADEFIVKSFSKLENDLSARKYIKYDINGDACALIKVRTDIDAVINFDSNTGIPVEPELKAKGEYWVYVVEGERALKCVADGFIPKTIPLESAGKIAKLTVYELQLSSKSRNIQILPVTILSDPEDAEKWVDGKKMGTGQNFELALGEHKLLIKKEGYTSVQKTIQVSKISIFFPDNVLNVIDLVPVEIRTEPKGATVYINGAERGKTNLPIWLYPGKYDLKLMLSGYLEKSESIVINEDKTNKFILSLVKNSGSLKLDIHPRDAICTINKTVYETKDLIELVPGIYKLELSCNGYDSVEERLAIKRGEIVSKTYILIQKTGGLQLSIVPLDANIFMKDSRGNIYKKWTGMHYDKAVPVGDYTLECSFPGYKPSKFSITVEENKIVEKSITLEEGLPNQAICVEGAPDMILVQGGSFEMGSNNGDSNEKLIHSVTVSDFYIGKYEVTQKQYEEVMGNNPSRFRGAKKPVENVSWYNAVAFCNRLSEVTGMEQVYTVNGKNVKGDFNKNGYRLPTEAEWEYAARGGRSSQGYAYSGSNRISHVAWYYYNSGSKTHAVGEKQPNELGLYDMSGNVLEWCWDWYGDYANGNQTDPIGPTSGSHRVLRGGSWGGSWSGNAGNCRVADRDDGSPSHGYAYIGFRIARTAE